MNLNVSEIAYIAGLFDGEGCVTCKKKPTKRKDRKNKVYDQWYIRCELAMTDKTTVEWLHHTLGFGWCKEKRYNNKIGIMCDVALDPYTSHGHDGLLNSGYVLNDETVEILTKQALLQAQMGCDVIAPSDMMDGRVGKIRKVLDKNGYHLVQILSYAVKYASSFYGPFRDAVGSKGSLKGDKKNYQMDYRNRLEAIREVSLDIKEGADIVMVKPGMPYLDVISLVKEKFKIPVFAYQVSGEYSLINNGIKKGIINQNAILESLISFKRAGANAIVTYYADKISKLLR